MSVSTILQAPSAGAAEDQLSPELAEVLEQYLVDLEQGRPPDNERVMAEHPQWGEALREYLASIELLHATWRREPVPGPDPVTAPPDRVGDYRILREVGRGGMGVVYEAMQISLERRVALKVLPPAVGLDRRQTTRFKNEALAAAQLQHPHIVPVHWVGCEQGVHCYAMRYIEGCSLEQRIEQLRRTRADGQPDPTGSADHWRLVARLGLQAADALEHAHQSGVVHRDIKPSNLLLDVEGQLWITDFGLARYHADTGLTRSGEVLGTLRYMSPEQLRGQPGLVDQRTDIYSLGATLYELLILEPAFAAEFQIELMQQVEACEPIAPRRRQRAIPIDLETVLLKAMARQRDDRYSTAAELADEFRRILAGAPVVARRPTVMERTVRWTQRHLRLVMAAALLSVAALGGTSAAAVLIAREKQQTERALSDARAGFSRAERNFQQARQIVDRFWTRAAGQLADLPGAEPLRQELLEEALAYYRSFLQQARGDRLLQAEFAAACFRVGEINERLGDDEEALRAYHEARDIWQSLAAKEQETQPRARLEADLALCENNIALALARSGQTEPSQTLLRGAIERQQRLVQAWPQQKRYRRELATSLNNLALQLGQTSRVEEASGLFQQAIRLYEQVLQKADDPECRSDLAAAWNNLAFLHSDSRPAAARAGYERALEMQRSLVEQFPGSLRLRSDLAQTCNNLGATAASLQDVNSAARSYHEAIDAQSKLIQAAPLTPEYRRQLAVTWNNLGFLHSEHAQFTEALQAFEQARDLFDQLARVDPARLSYRSSLGGVHNNLGMVHERLEQLEAAESAYLSAISQQQAAVDDGPQVQRYREFLGTHYLNLGRVQRTQGNCGDAQQTALRLKQLWPNDPQRLYRAACELALTAAGMTEEAEQLCLEETWAALREAQAAGFSDARQLEQDDLWRRFRDDPALRLILADLAGNRPRQEPTSDPNEAAP